ncbi:MAG: SapC family protein [Burkholderiaceae bacterium]|nr:SapC family protein [Burkholderiaceae bacterium]
MLIYETAVPVSGGRHGKASIEAGQGFAFARKVNSVPLMALEFPEAAPEYAIVFAQSGDDVVPVAILGARQNENLYLAEDNSWRGRYIPAFIRRYPFVFSTSEDGKTFTLCVDESYKGLNYEGRGAALFNEDGKPSPHVDRVLKFLQEYRAQFLRTQQFGKKLKELDLLEPMQAQFTLPAGDKMALTGFMAVDRKRLKALKGEQLASLASTDELELIYLHLQSMRNFVAVKDRLVGQATKDGASPAATEGAAQEAGSKPNGAAKAAAGPEPVAAKPNGQGSKESDHSKGKRGAGSSAN